MSNLEINKIISEIVELELFLTDLVSKGHKASTDDDYQDKRERLKELRKLL